MIILTVVYVIAFADFYSLCACSQGFSADPYSTGIAAWHSVKGLQDSGVTATAKHFIAYEQETYRNLVRRPP